MSGALISARKLVERFVDFTAVDGIDVEVAPESRGVPGVRTVRGSVDDADDGLWLALTDGELRLVGAVSHGDPDREAAVEVTCVR